MSLAAVSRRSSAYQRHHRQLTALVQRKHSGHLDISDSLHLALKTQEALNLGVPDCRRTPHGEETVGQHLAGAQGHHLPSVGQEGFIEV